MADDMKEYLEQMKQVNHLIDLDIAELDKLRQLAISLTVNLEERVQSCRKEDKTCAIITKIVDLEAKVNDDIDRLVDMKRQVITAIHQMSDNNERRLIELRYLQGKAWEQIAREMGYSIRQIYRINENALNNIPLIKDGTLCH